MKRRVATDCLRHLRVCYYLDVPLKRELFELFPGDEITVNEFSRHVADACDQFTIVRPGLFHAAGVIDQRLLIVTYGKIGTEERDGIVRELEEKLAAYEGNRVHAGTATRP